MSAELPDYLMSKWGVFWVLVAVVVLIFLGCMADRTPLIDQSDTPWNHDNAEYNRSQSGE